MTTSTKTRNNKTENETEAKAAKRGRGLKPVHHTMTAFLIVFSLAMLATITLAAINADVAAFTALTSISSGALGYFALRAARKSQSDDS